jgi:hypothetical protein
MGPTALLPLRRKCVLWIFITRKNPPSYNEILRLLKDFNKGIPPLALTNIKKTPALLVVKKKIKGSKTQGNFCKPITEPGSQSPYQKTWRTRRSILTFQRCYTRLHHVIVALMSQSLLRNDAFQLGHCCTNVIRSHC